MRIGRLFIGAQRTNDRSPKYVLATWSYRGGYWRWALYWSPYFGWRICGGPGMDCGRKYRIGGHFSAWARIPLLGGFSFATQPAWRHQ